MIRVLLVEDDPMVAELNRVYLSRVAGFEMVASVRSAAEALDLLRDRPVDLLLLDIFMPGQSGLELMEEIRRQALDVDVIFVTAARDTRTIDRALKLGAVDYLIKPFEFERLKQALDRYGETRRLIRGGRALDQTELDRRLARQPVDGPKLEGLPKGLDRNTLDKVLRAIEAWPGEGPGFTSEDIGQQVGISRVSVRKYVEFLCTLRVLRMEPGYGTGGRPVHRFQLQRAHLPQAQRFL
ncbi:two-component system response regulator DcuR [Geothrix limicola]|uniref:Transcriptional regulatory protein n=1 Tax=Geothrix limicola TaxID=2927978 RepID=A0ABQ5QG88_9BACT|nr:response regulator [Geothrix limicola]GLH73378.1 two-component system response regulator DcuR [Geothrix limicola]